MFTAKLASAINSNPRNAQFASVEYTSPVQTAAKHRDTIEIVKTVSAKVIVFATGYAYTAAVKRSAERLGNTVTEFATGTTHFEHTDCYSIVENKRSGKPYLYCAVQSANSQYWVNGTAATRSTVAKYLTPSAAKKLLEPSNEVYNKTNDVTHDLQIRTIALENIQMAKVNNQVITNK